MERKQLVSQRTPKDAALGTVEYQQLLVRLFPYRLYESEVIHRHTDKDDTRNISPHYAVATLTVVVIAMAFVILQHG